MHNQRFRLGRWTRYDWQRCVGADVAPLAHEDVVLPDELYAVVRIRRVGRVAVLHGEAVAVIDEDAAVGYVVPEQAPEGIARRHGAALDRLVPLREVVTRRRGPAVEPGPVVLTGEVGLLGGGDWSWGLRSDRDSRKGTGKENSFHALAEEQERPTQLQIGLQFANADGVEVVGHDVDLLDSEVRRVDAVRAVDDQLFRRQRLDMGSNLGQPRCRAIHIPPDRTSQLVAGLVGEDGGVVGVREPGVLVHVREQLRDVVLEGRHNGRVGVELHDLRAGRVVGLRQVEAIPAEEVVLAAVVIVLWGFQHWVFWTVPL